LSGTLANAHGACLCVFSCSEGRLSSRRLRTSTVSCRARAGSARS
jgi:hypothetical protein